MAITAGQIVFMQGNASDCWDMKILTPEQGDLFYFDGTNWNVLAHGTAGQYLKTGGHAANPSWDSPVKSTLTKAITVESPTATEDISIFFTDIAITINKIVAVLVGSATPSVTWTIRHGTDRSATGAEVVTSGTTTTSVSTGSVITSFNDATIIANSYIWLETTAQSGTVGQIAITIEYTED